MTTESQVPPAEPELFGPDSLSWDMAGQYLYAVGTSSAFVLQVMNPAIGAVVDRWSVYRSDPWGRADRSFASVQTWIYGGRTALEESKRLRLMHRSLEATDEQGRHHHALTAEPWAWVPLTAFHAAQTYAEYFALQPVSDADLDRVYQEVLQLCRILQVQEHLLPPTRTEFASYFDDMIENVLEDHPTAHKVLTAFENPLPHPVVPAALRPLWAPVGGTLGRFSRLLAVGTLPAAAREKLGLSWSGADEKLLRAGCRVAAEINERLPERLRYMPIAYRAREAAKARQRLEDVLATRPI